MLLEVVAPLRLQAFAGQAPISQSRLVRALAERDACLLMQLPYHHKAQVESQGSSPKFVLRIELEFTTTPSR